MVDNAAGLLERAPVRAGLAAARGSRTPIRREHAVILVATPLIVGRCAGLPFASLVGVPRSRYCENPSPHAECELSTVSRGTTHPCPMRRWHRWHESCSLSRCPAGGRLPKRIA